MGVPPSTNNTAKAYFGEGLVKIRPAVAEQSRQKKTSSSAVAERPRDAVSNSSWPQQNNNTCTESFIIVTEASYLQLRNVVFGVMPRLLVIHFVELCFLPSTNSAPFPAYQRLVLWTRHDPSQLSVLHLLLERFTACIETRYWLRIAISAYPTCIRRPR